LLLGCTHYPFLARTIADVMGRDVVLVSSADETAFEVRAILGGVESGDGGVGRGADEPGSLQVFSSGDVEWFRTVGSRLFGEELGEVRGLSWPEPPPVPQVGSGATGRSRPATGHASPGAASG
jgi:glutamate racemase